MQYTVYIDNDTFINAFPYPFFPKYVSKNFFFFYIFGKYAYKQSETQNILLSILLFDTLLFVSLLHKAFCPFHMAKFQS